MKHSCIPALVPLEGGSLTIQMRSVSSAQAQHPSLPGRGHSLGCWEMLGTLHCPALAPSTAWMCPPATGSILTAHGCGIAITLPTGTISWLSLSFLQRTTLSSGPCAVLSGAPFASPSVVFIWPPPCLKIKYWGTRKRSNLLDKHFFPALL